MAAARPARKSRRQVRKTQGKKRGNEGSWTRQDEGNANPHAVGSQSGVAGKLLTLGRRLGGTVAVVLGAVAKVVAAIGLLGGCLAFMIEMEDRQAERIFRAWEVVSEAGPTKQIEVAGSGPTVGNSNTNAGRALEFLNREFSGWGCINIVKGVARLTTGDVRRECVFPRKRRESLAGLGLSNMYLEKVWLPRALLKLTQLESSFLQKANLKKADLTCANLASSMLVSAEMGGAILKRARMRSANLMEARLTNSDLRGANLVAADLKATNLDEATMGCLETASGIRVCTDVRGATALTCAQLRKAKNWESAYRDDSMQCGGTMPMPDQTEAFSIEGDTGKGQREDRSIRNMKWDHDGCPYETANPRDKISVQR